MKHIKEFSRFSSSYQYYKIIQSRVAAYLVANTPFKGERILDLGAGTGEVFSHINWSIKRFYALDLSKNMLSFHPDAPFVKKIVASFDDFDAIPQDIDQIFAASSLQWSKDLDSLLAHLAKITPSFNAALFTANTFKTIWQITGKRSPIPSKEYIITTLRRNFNLHIEVKEYKLFFLTKRDIFGYIKKSGVSAGQKRLSFRETKELIKKYPYNYLEFEVVFAWSKSY